MIATLVVACALWTLPDVIEDIKANDGRVIAVVPVNGETYTGLLVADIAGHIVVSTVVGQCVTSRPILVGPAAVTVEH